MRRHLLSEHIDGHHNALEAFEVGCQLWELGVRNPGQLAELLERLFSLGRREAWQIVASLLRQGGTEFF